MYYCCNVVTEAEGIGAALLIRALEPILGLAIMIENRKNSHINKLTSGSGMLCQALMVNKTGNGLKESSPHPHRFYIKGNPYVAKY